VDTYFPAKLDASLEAGQILVTAFWIGYMKRL
jgi:hypothetical protein